MLGISAMAVQNALVQISLKDSPSTAMMTTNTTRFVIDLGEVLLGPSRNRVKAGERAKRKGFVIAGFVIGCGLGAGCQAVTGLWSRDYPLSLRWWRSPKRSSMWSRSRSKGSADGQDQARGLALEAEFLCRFDEGSDDQSDVERFMAKRMGAKTIDAKTIEMKASHLSLISQPEVVGFGQHTHGS
jgi:Protein of unknown function (DUF1275)